MFRVVKDLATFITGLISTLLLFRFVLKLLGANSEAAIVAWIFETTQPLLRPFLMAFPTSSIRGGFTLEFTTLFALFVYTFAGYLIQELLETIEGRHR